MSPSSRRTGVDLTSYAELAVRLVNTGGGVADGSRPDELASIESYRSLMAGHDYPVGRVVPADLDALRQLRRDLRLIFGAFAGGSAEDAAARLNALLARHPIHPEIARHDDQAWHLHHAKSGSVADQYAAGAVLGLTRVITELGRPAAPLRGGRLLELVRGPDRGRVTELLRGPLRRDRERDRAARAAPSAGGRPGHHGRRLTGPNRRTPARAGRATPAFRPSPGTAAPRVMTWTDRNPRYRNDSAAFFSGCLTIITMRPTHGAYAPRMRTGKWVRTMATEAVAPATRPADVGLKREMGLIGATWASETSIIGSGWLFGALFAAQAAGTAALLGWVIAGVIVIILALVHAELGGMYPVSGGTARFPHFAFGSIAGISFGFFSWLQAVTVAPIECFAVMTYGSYYWHGLYDPVNGQRHHDRLRDDDRADGDLHRDQLPGHAAVLQGQRGHHLVEGGRPGPRHHRAAVQVQPQEPRRGRRLHALRDQGAVRGHPLGRHRVRLPRLRAGRPAGGRDQEPAEEPAPGDPDGHRHRHRDLRAAPVRVHRRHPAQPDLRAQGLGGYPGYQPDRHRPVRRPGWRDRAQLAGRHPAPRRVRLTVRHRPDLPDLDLPGRLRPGP